jgi:hypothetical protein
MTDSTLKTVGDVLKNFNPLEDKYISREFQHFGIYISEELGDYKHKALYIKLAKTTDRALLERALSFTKDSNAKNRGALFMWKLKQLKDERKKNEKQAESVKRKV